MMNSTLSKKCCPASESECKNSLTRDLEIIAAMLPAMPEFKRKRQRPNLPRGSGGKKYDRYRAVVQYQRENAGSETLTTVEIVRRLLKANHKDFIGYPRGIDGQDVSEGIWKLPANSLVCGRSPINHRLPALPFNPRSIADDTIFPWL